MKIASMSLASLKCMFIMLISEEQNLSTEKVCPQDLSCKGMSSVHSWINSGLVLPDGSVEHC